MIEIENLRFSYPGARFRLAVDAFRVDAGQRVAIVGPSGSGKTTLLNLVAGLLVPDEGRVTVAGADVGALRESERRSFRARNIGFVFQNFALLDYLTVRANILYPFRIAGTLRLDREARERARRLAEACGLAGKDARHPGELSQGEQQRVAICRALVTEPGLILADEATGNLDPDNKQAILDLLFRQAAECDATLLAVTHDRELLPHFDRVIDFADFRQVAET
jgi:putative ABC transport system ATP-binding protein